MWPSAASPRHPSWSCRSSCRRCSTRPAGARRAACAALCDAYLRRTPSSPGPCCCGAAPPSHSPHSAVRQCAPADRRCLHHPPPSRQARRAAAHPVPRHGEAAQQHHPLRRPHADAAVARGVGLPRGRRRQSCRPQVRAMWSGSRGRSLLPLLLVMTMNDGAAAAAAPAAAAAAAAAALFLPATLRPSYATRSPPANCCRAHENTLVSELLAAHLALQPGAAARHHALREHREAGLEALTVVMRKERTPVGAWGRADDNRVEPAAGRFPRGGFNPCTALHCRRPCTAAGVLPVCSCASPCRCRMATNPLACCHCWPWCRPTQCSTTK